MSKFRSYNQFETLITPRMVVLIHYILIGVAILTSAVYIVMGVMAVASIGLSYSFLSFGFALIGVPFAYLVLRIWLEAFLVLFSILEELRKQ
ncbi:DUF4282 domain-containing protein [Gemmatimonadota bacterium]